MAGVSLRVLRPGVGDQGGQTGAADSPGPAGTVFHSGFRALPEVGEGTGCGPGRDVHPGGVHPQGKGNHRGVVRPCLFGLGHRVNKTLDDSLERFAKQEFMEVYPYLVLDARYEKMRCDGVIRCKRMVYSFLTLLHKTCTPLINWRNRRPKGGSKRSRQREA